MSTRTFNLNWGTSGLAASIYYRVLDDDNVTLVARTNSGVTETPASSGLYQAAISGFGADWSGRIIWDDGTNFAEEEFEATSTAGGSSQTSTPSLIFNRLIRDTNTGDPLDADSTPTISIVRLDTSATVVATTSTGVTHPSTGQYSYQYDNPVSGVTYRATWTFIVGGQTVSSSSDQTASSSSWYYAEQADVEDLIGLAALKQISNMPGVDSDTAVDTARLQRTGEYVDALMDAELSRLGYTTPLVQSGAAPTGGTALILAAINAGMVVRELNRPRAMLNPIKGVTEVDRRLWQSIGDAESDWRRLKLGLLNITGDRNFARRPLAAASVGVPTSNTWGGAIVYAGGIIY